MSDIVKSADLYFREGSSDKVYHAQIKKQGNGYIVLFAYGRRGAHLATGTKTSKPVELDKALAIFAKLVSSKAAKGYKLNGSMGGTITVASERSDTGVRAQLLNEVPEAEIQKYIDDDDWCAQEKFDGKRRMLILKDNLAIGTNREGLESAFNDNIKSELESLNFNIILDGEDMGDHIMLFDIIKRGPSYKERYDILNRVLETNENKITRLKIVETAWTTIQKAKLFSKLKKENAEGIVFKRKSAQYHPNRPASGGDQLKFKFCETASCIVLKANPTKRSIEVAVQDEDGYSQVSVGNVTVYPNQEIPEPGSIVEVKYLYYFPGGSLFQPVLLGEGDCTRDDVHTVDCSITKLKAKRENVQEEA